VGPDDKTTEIELPQARRLTDIPRSNIVHVNFSQKSKRNDTPSWEIPLNQASVSVGKFRPRTVDRISPWMIRAIALLGILLLSLLVL
jgi:hypothetical protein